MKTKTVKTRKPGSGRTKGSFSFVKLTLGQIKDVIKDDKFSLLVSRKQAEVLFPDAKSARIQDLTPRIETEQTKIQVKVVDLNKEEPADKE